MLGLVLPSAEQPADSLADGRADAAGLVWLVVLAALATGLAVLAGLLAPLTGLLAGLTIAAAEAALATAKAALLAAHLAAHTRGAAADMGHATAVATAGCAALMLGSEVLAPRVLAPRVLAGLLLAGLGVNAVALAAIVLLTVAAPHGLAVTLTIGARAVLAAITRAARIIGTRGLTVAALRLAVAALPFGLPRLIAAL